MSFKKITNPKNSAYRRRIQKNLLTSLILEGKVQTTLPRAKKARSQFEKLITLAKKQNIASRRRVAAKINVAEKNKKKAIDILFSDIAPKYKTRNGGYTRLLKIKNRLGDNATIAEISLV